MANPRVASLLSVAAIVLCTVTTAAQSTNEPGSNSTSVAHVCGAAKVIPLTGSEPPAKIFIDPPLAEPLASRGVVIMSLEN